MHSSHIVVAQNLESALTEICDGLLGAFFIFPKPYKEQADFLVEDADEMIAEAYLTEDGGKWIVTKALTYRPEAQNRLLKLLEEPPSGVKFIILTKSKSFLLPTIRSRLPILQYGGAKSYETWSQPKNSTELALVLKETEAWNKETAKQKLAAFLAYIANNGHIAMDLKRFDMAYELLALNARPNIIFACLFNDLKKF